MSVWAFVARVRVNVKVLLGLKRLRHCMPSLLISPATNAPEVVKPSPCSFAPTAYMSLVGVMYSGEYDVCGVIECTSTLGNLKSLPDYGGNRTYPRPLGYFSNALPTELRGQVG